MKLKLLTIILLIGSNLYLNAQSYIEKLEPNIAWKKYSLIIQQEGNWNFHFVLKEGYIDSVKFFYKDDYRSGYKILYNDNKNLNYEIEVFNINGLECDTIERYDTDGLHVNDEYKHYEYNKKKLLIQLQSARFVKSNKYRWMKEFKYNKNGTVKIKKDTDFNGNKKQVEIARFKYNKCSNVSEVRNSSNPEMKYPIIGYGTRNTYKLERFEYKYDDDCVWIEKYSVIDGNKRLIAKRIFTKIN